MVAGKGAHVKRAEVFDAQAAAALGMGKGHYSQAPKNGTPEKPQDAGVRERAQSADSTKESSAMIASDVTGTSGTSWPGLEGVAAAEEPSRMTINISHREPVSLAIECMAALLAPPSAIYIHGFELVQLAQTSPKDSLGRRIIMQPLIVPALEVALARKAHFERNVGDQGGVETTRPPKATARDILHWGAEHWPFPPIAAISEAPLFLPDGRILAAPGYDSGSQIYYAGPVLTGLPVNPTRDDALALRRRSRRTSCPRLSCEEFLLASQHLRGTHNACRAAYVPRTCPAMYCGCSHRRERQDYRGPLGIDSEQWLSRCLYPLSRGRY
jgi:hypothetical protein